MSGDQGYPDEMLYFAASHLGLHYSIRPVCPNTYVNMVFEDFYPSFFKLTFTTLWANSADKISTIFFFYCQVNIDSMLGRL